jgi:Ulp1 family protease
MGKDKINCSHDCVARWTKDVDIFKLDEILIPIKENLSHWIAVKVSMSQKATELHNPTGQRQRWSEVQVHLNNIFLFIKDEHLKRKREVLPDASSWRLLTLQD